MMMNVVRFKHKVRRWTVLGTAVLWFLNGGAADAADLRIAVASNFSVPAKHLSKLFEAATGIRVLVSTGSTGKLYAQIKNGAPYDVFLAANAREPEMLEREGFGVAGSRFTYAQGRLAVWCRTATTPKMARACLDQNHIKIAIANPRLAPYGAAAEMVLDRLALSQSLQQRLVFGENIAQAFQMVWSGNVPVGLVALSQVKARSDLVGAFWRVDGALHETINQQAIRLKGANEVDSQKFVDFLQSETGRSAIESFGYALNSTTNGGAQ